MEVRKTTVKDVDTVMKIIEESKEYFREQHINQWQDGYPNRKTILEDIIQGISYLLVDENNAIIATAAISFYGEETYNQIDGAWLNDEAYVVIHRIAVNKANKGQNLASILINFAHLEASLKQIYNIRIDTHKDNYSMQRFLLKNNFTFCGIISLDSGDKRLAFQRRG